MTSVQPMSWYSLELRSVGSEGGEIVWDEEHEFGARITLEKECGKVPFAITCGVYGWMVHTRFFGEWEVAAEAYRKMKCELGELLDLLPDQEDLEEERAMEPLVKAIHDFVARNP